MSLVAIVGPPNAGKSTLLNKIAGQHFAVTSEVEGTTRDRQYVDVTWSGRTFTMVDTAGLMLNQVEGLEDEVNKQIDVAVNEADVLLFVVDGKSPISSIKQQALLKFRKIKKPTLLVVNKMDSPKKIEENSAEFLKLGIKPMHAVSALSGRGIGDLLDDVLKVLPKDDDAKQRNPNSIQVALVGKPNVGKSSLFNKLINEDRVVVSKVPGTTRTAIDSQVDIDGTKFTFIDTAGLKKKTQRQERPDIYSGFQTYKSIRRSDVSILVLDSLEEITKQDQAIAQEIFSQGKGCIIIANKIDGFKKSDLESEIVNLQARISAHFPFLWMCPVFFVSAETGEGLHDAVSAIKPIYERRIKELPEDEVEKLLGKAMKKNPPKLLRDQKKPKVYGLAQVGSNPPVFELTVNYPGAISQQFRKFLEKGIIKELDFWGTPIGLKLAKKN